MASALSGKKKAVSFKPNHPGSGRGRFSEYEIGYVVKHYANLGPTRVAVALGRPASSVVQLARRLNLSARPKHSYDTEEMDRRIRERYAAEGAAGIAQEMGVPRVTVNVRAAAIGVRRNPGCARRLTEGDVARIKRLISEGLSDSEIGRQFGVSGVTVASIRKRRTWISVEAEADDRQGATK